MNFDYPEAQLSFGKQNKQSCTKCRWRKGRSAFRHGSVQKGTAIKRLYRIANNAQSRYNTMAREKLNRWGFNYLRQNTLHKNCNHFLVCIPGSDEVFPGVDFRDIMHALKIFLHRVCVLDTLAVIPLSASAKRILYGRLRKVLHKQTFRDSCGTTYRPVTDIFTGANMTARDKVNLFFLLPHVLGHKGDILPPCVRDPMLTAIAHAQLLIIASSGNRSYNRNELTTIFDKSWVLLFGALEKVHSECYSMRVQQARLANKEPPAPVERTSRSVCLCE